MKATATRANKERRLSFRMADADYENLVRRCEDMGLSKSQYLRYLVRIPMLPEETADAKRCVVLDMKTFSSMARELTKWGYHYNQAVHAMNTINYYATRGRFDDKVLEGKGESIEVALTSVNRNAERIAYELGEFQWKTLLMDA